MKALRWLLLVASVASAQTYYDKTTIAPTGATNTVLGNKTSATAAPTYMAMGTCSTSSSALIWTTNTGFGCNTSINAATLLTGTWAAPGSIGSGTPAAGSFTSLGATSFSLAAGTSYSGASWGSTSPVFNVLAMTLNDTTASGTVTSDDAITIQAPVFTSTGGASTTITNPTTLYVNAPTCSGGVVCSVPFTALFNGVVRTNGLLIPAAGITSSGGVISLNASSNNATNIGTGTSNGTVTIGGGSNTVALNGSAVTVAGTTIGLTGATTNTGALTVTGLITPSTTIGVLGTTAADQAQAGSIGEVVSLNCLVSAAAASATVVSFTNASPTVVTWSSHTFVPSTGLANYTCPINFPGGTPPTGVSAGVTYYIIGSTVSGDTFQIADTAAHALAGTNAINTSSTGTNPTAYIGALGANNTTVTGAAVKLVAGDWDCTHTATYQEITSITSTRFTAWVDTSIAVSTIGNGTSIQTASSAIGAASSYLTSPIVRENISATTSIFGNDVASFSGGSMNQGGFLRCRRMR